MSKHTDQKDGEFSDEIKREDVYAFIAFLFFLACLGVLYLLGKSDGRIGVAATILAVACLMIGIGIRGRLQEYQDKGWKKDWRTPRVERIERRVALYV